MARLYDEGGRAPRRAFVYDVRFDDEQTTCKDRQEDFAEHRNGFRHRMVYVAGERFGACAGVSSHHKVWYAQHKRRTRLCNDGREDGSRGAEADHWDNYTRVLYKGAAGKRALAERVETSTHSRIKDRRGQFDACVDLVFDHLNDNGVIEAMRYLLELAQNPKYRTDAVQPDTQHEDEKL